MAGISSKIAPCLCFDGEAEAAANFYVSAFADGGVPSAIKWMMRYGKGGPGPEGSVQFVTFTLGDQEFSALNAGPQFVFSPAISLMVNCADQAELDGFWSRLSAGGETGQCGWLTDRFGVSWQIAPDNLEDLLGRHDPARRDRVMAAVMSMTKLDIAGLERAADGVSAA